MSVARNCASGSLVLYAKETLKSNQMNALAASMESVWVHLHGTPNLYGLKSGASAGRMQCWVYIIDGPIRTAALTVMCRDRSGQRGSKGRKHNFIGLLQLPPS